MVDATVLSQDRAMRVNDPAGRPSPSQRLLYGCCVALWPHKTNLLAFGNIVYRQTRFKRMFFYLVFLSLTQRENGS